MVWGIGELAVLLVHLNRPEINIGENTHESI